MTANYVHISALHIWHSYWRSLSISVEATPSNSSKYSGYYLNCIQVMLHWPSKISLASKAMHICCSHIIYIYKSKLWWGTYLINPCRDGAPRTKSSIAAKETYSVIAFTISTSSSSTSKHFIWHKKLYCIYKKKKKKLFQVNDACLYNMLS